MDDNSQDGTPTVIERLNKEWVHLYVRTRDRSLSQAVCEGLAKAKNEIFVVMDADLSHPPASIVDLVDGLEEGYDFVLGSRYVKGGTTGHDWGFLRWANSRIATLLALPFTTIRDPMSGFFAISRKTYLKASHFNPIGYKIGLEILVKCGCDKIHEVPIHFENRKFGESKLTFTEQLKYIQHIRRLFTHKYGTWSHLLQFLIVGSLGMVVNLGLLTIFLALTIPVNASIGLAISISMLFNFFLNRRYTFSYARRNSMFRQLIGFIGACSIGAIANYLIATGILLSNPELSPQLAAVFGIIVGSGINFTFNRYGVFKQEHFRV